MYCTAVEIYALFPGLNQTNTRITLDSINKLITQESAYIDSFLSTIYKTPVLEADSPKSFAILAKICRGLVFPYIYQRLEIKAGDIKQFDAAKEGTSFGMGDLIALRENRAILPDATIIKESLEVNTFDNYNLPGFKL